MFWQVRASLEDRPGAMAALALRCGKQKVNILSLQIFPAAEGRVVDEIILRTPEGWTSRDLARLCVGAGVRHPVVSKCEPHKLEDQPVRYVRAAEAILGDPALLEDQLCRLLDCGPADGTPGLDTLLLDDGEGPRVELSRPVAFTDTELARAAQLRRLAGVALGGAVGGRAGAAPAASVIDGPAQPTIRRGVHADASRLVAMHARCSAETLFRRYHAPVTVLTSRMSRTLLEPETGLSMVLTVGDDVVGIGMLAEGSAGPELGLLVEDSWQHRGLGARLLRQLAVEAANQGATSLTCLVQPDNRAVLRTIRRAGFRAHVSEVDGLMQYTLSVARLASQRLNRGGRPAMGEVTAPLVELLHVRSELRVAYPPADFIDQAVRG